MPVRSFAAKLDWRNLGPWTQDILIGLSTFIIGLLIFLTGLHPVWGVNDQPLWPRLLVFAVLCVLEAFRRKAPVAVLGLATVLVIVDSLQGLLVPPLIAFADLLYAATLYGPRKFGRAMIPVAAIGTLAAAVAGLVLTAGWRNAVLMAVATLPFLIVPVWWATHIRQYRDIAEAERANASQLTKIAELDRQAAIASERTRMARDLHDVIAGHLSAIALQSEAVLSTANNPNSAPTTSAKTAATDETTHKVLASIRDNSVQALDEMRAMIGLLRADQVDRDELAAPAGLAELDTLIDSAKASGVRLTVTMELAETVALPAAVDLAAYRIIQEALTNVSTHAPGAPAQLDIRHHGDTLTVQVTNELTRPAGRSSSFGIGLINMRERANAVGGSFFAKPITEGWHVRAVLPTTHHEHQP